MVNNNTDLSCDEVFEVESVMIETLQQFSIGTIAKAIVLDAFRNGPIEDMHADGKLSDDDMKTLNKHMVNKIARILEMWNCGDYHGLLGLMLWGSMNSIGWDEPEIEMADINALKEEFPIEAFYQAMQLNGGKLFPQNM